MFIAMVNFFVGLNFFQNKKLKQRNNFKTNTTPNEIMDLVNDSKVKAKSLSRVRLLVTERPHGLQPTRPSVHGIFQARVLEWGATAFSAGAAW